MLAQRLGLSAILAVMLAHAPMQAHAQNPPRSAASAAVVSSDLEFRKLALESAKLEDEMRRTQIQRDAEDRLARAEPSHWMRIVGVLGTPLSILVSIAVAVVGYRSQAKAALAQQAAQTDALKAQLRLKAAEIAMDARSAAQIENKAKALAALFPDDLEGFGAEFDKAKVKLGHSVERRQALLELLAAHPGERKRTLETWAAMFPWDARDWLRPILESEDLPVPPAKA